MDWVQIGSTFGVPVLLLAATGYFIVRHVWPFVIKQLEASQEERRQERLAWERDRQAFVESLRQINQNQAASTQAIEQIAQSIGRIEADAKQRRRLQQ